MKRKGEVLVLGYNRYARSNSARPRGTGVATGNDTPPCWHLQQDGIGVDRMWSGLGICNSWFVTHEV